MPEQSSSKLHSESALLKEHPEFREKVFSRLKVHFLHDAPADSKGVSLSRSDEDMLIAYLQAWMDNSCQPISSLRAVDSGRRDSALSIAATAELLRKSLLAEVKADNPGYVPTSKAVALICSDQRLKSRLSGAARKIQISADSKLLHLDARNSLLKVVSELQDHTDVSIRILTEILGWSENDIVSHIKACISDRLLALNKSQTGIIVTPRGMEIASGSIAELVVPKRSVTSKEAVSLLEHLVPDIIYHLSTNLNLKLGLTAQEIAKAAAIIGHKCCTTYILDRLVDQGKVLRQKYKQDNSDPELSRLTAVSYLYRVSAEYQPHQPDLDFRNYVQEFRKYPGAGIYSCKRNGVDSQIAREELLDMCKTFGTADFAPIDLKVKLKGAGIELSSPTVLSAILKNIADRGELQSIEIAPRRHLGHKTVRHRYRHIGAVSS